MNDGNVVVSPGKDVILTWKILPYLQGRMSHEPGKCYPIYREGYSVNQGNVVPSPGKDVPITWKMLSYLQGRMSHKSGKCCPIFREGCPIKQCCPISMEGYPVNKENIVKSRWKNVILWTREIPVLSKWRDATWPREMLLRVWKPSWPQAWHKNLHKMHVHWLHQMPAHSMGCINRCFDMYFVSSHYTWKVLSRCSAGFVESIIHDHLPGSHEAQKNKSNESPHG